MMATTSMIRLISSAAMAPMGRILFHFAGDAFGFFLQFLAPPRRDRRPGLGHDRALLLGAEVRPRV